MTPNKKTSDQKPKQCFFCKHQIEHIDYKDIRLLSRFLSSFAKIVPRKRSHSCTSHQRKLALAIKRARIMALIPFVRT